MKPDDDPATYYRAGGWVTIVGEHTWMLAEIDPVGALAAECWAIIGSAGDTDALLGAIADEGLRTVPNFAIAEVRQRMVRVLVRGHATATIESSNGMSAEVSGVGAPTWVDQAIEHDATSVMLSASGQNPGATDLPISVGMAMASRVSFSVPKFAALPAPATDSVMSERGNDDVKLTDVIETLDPEDTLSELAESTGVPTDPAVEADIAVTIGRSHLAGDPRVTAGPTVLAVLCPNAHLTPAHGGSCRLCGSAVRPQEPFEAPRPILGLLRLSTGAVVLLDRGVILGRAPTAPDQSDPDRPNVLKLENSGNDLSRSHAHVRLNGWDVLVVDLGSTNGTVLSAPGVLPLRLTPHQPVSIQPGTTVVLADQVSFIYELPEQSPKR